VVLPNCVDIEDLSRYLGSEPALQYEDFNVKSKDYRIFRVQDYCWKEDGFELVRRFLPDAAPLLDKLFDFIYNLTYNRLNQYRVNTTPFRRATWQYVQRIKGMFHDDYDYADVNRLLNMHIKAFIKKIACQPDSVTKADYKNLCIDLTHDEKVHVALLAVESAKQSELLYGLHAIMGHMYNK